MSKSQKSNKTPEKTQNAENKQTKNDELLMVRLQRTYNMFLWLFPAKNFSQPFMENIKATGS